MKKVKILEREHRFDLEEAVNEFIKDIDLVDIKYCGATARPPYSIVRYSAMVIYNR